MQNVLNEMRAKNSLHKAEEGFEEKCLFAQNWSATLTKEKWRAEKEEMFDTNQSFLQP